MNKYCYKCKTVKPASDFACDASRKDGHSHICRLCSSAKDREYYSKNRNSKREKGRGRYWENPKKERDRVDRYRKNNPRKVYDYFKKKRIEQPEKNKARMAVFYAKRSGKIAVPSGCENCGASTNLQAHHQDYSKPLDIKWLCPKCHNALTRIHA